MTEGDVISLEMDAARFRGEYLNCCAQIEDHAGEALVQMKRLGLLTKAPYLFGAKFKVLLEHAPKPGIWQDSRRATEVLERLQPYAAMRGVICHAVMMDVVIGDVPSVFWKMPGASDCAPRPGMSHFQIREMLRELAGLTTRFRNQQIAKTLNQASSPPQP